MYKLLDLTAKLIRLIYKNKYKEAKDVVKDIERILCTYDNAC